MRHVVLFGPPASGKGTQAARLAERHGLFPLSTGRLLRQQIADDTEQGRAAKRHIDAGELVPDDVVNALVRETLKGLNGDVPAVVFDGYPRTEGQAEALESLLEERGERIDLALLLEVGDEEVEARLAGRRECSQCGAVYNLHFNPPADPSRCSACGGELVQRDDDTPAAIRHRLLVHRERTRPLIDHCRELGVLATVDGEKTIDEVHEEILRALGGALGREAEG